MARQLRVENRGAIYHVMERGDRRDTTAEKARHMLHGALDKLGWAGAELAP